MLVFSLILTDVVEIGEEITCICENWVGPRWALEAWCFFSERIFGAAKLTWNTRRKHCLIPTFSLFSTARNPNTSHVDPKRKARTILMFSTPSHKHIMSTLCLVTHFHRKLHSNKAQRSREEDSCSISNSGTPFSNKVEALALMKYHCLACHFTLR